MDGLDHNLKPGFALSLSFDGITLLHRAAGGWRLVGEVALDVADLQAELAELRARADRLEPGHLACKLIIPNDQIRYLTINTGEHDLETRETLVLRELDGATPYQVEELAFDLSPDGDQTHVAAVARETLEEAEAFAVDNGFSPTSFVAVPGDYPFLGEPHFGTAAAMGGVEVTPDGVAVVVVGTAVYPDAESETDDDTDSGSAPVAVASDDTESSGAPNEPEEIPAIGFTSRRGKPSTDSSAADRAAPSPAAPASAAVASQKSPPRKPASSDTSKVPFVGSATQKSLEATDGAPLIGAPDLDIPLPASHDNAAGTGTAASRQVGTESTGKSIPAAQPIVTEPDDTAPLTPFVERKREDVGGKPRFLGPALIALLLLFMAAAAAWAVLTSDVRLSDLFRSSPVAEPETGIQAEPEPEAGAASSEETPPAVVMEPEPEAVVPETPVEIPDISLLPAPEPVPETAPADAVAAPEIAGTDSTSEPNETQAVPELTDTDIAVLDALSELPGDTPPTSEDPAVDAPPANTVSDPDTLNEPARYAATGIWSSAPAQSETPAIIGLGDLYLATIDRTDLSQDAIALPAPESLRTDIALVAPGSPSAPGTHFELDSQGLVNATPEGTLNPEGILVRLGRPSVVPPARPARLSPEPEAVDQTRLLAGLRPKIRPSNLDTRIERARLGGLSREELARHVPRLRPESVQQRAEQLLAQRQQRELQAQEQEQTETADADSAPADDISSASKYAVATAIPPRPRPSNMAALVKSARKNAGSRTAAIAPATVTPSIPSTASVARQATLENALNLRQINLIGVYGSPSDRRALVRLPSGRYRKVKVGDKVDGGTIIAIGDNSLRYEKRGRNQTLKIPNG